MNLETYATSLLRQSQMTSGYEEKEAINSNYINEGKNPIYTSKTWIHTHRGETTRHMSNHMQKVPFNEPFIVVNDKTLHIDEMMYPCDPAGSFQNAFICYCEVDYDDKGAYLDGVPRGTTYKTPQVTFANKLKPKTPVAPTNVPASVNVKPYMNVKIGEPVAEIINNDVDGIISVPHNYILDGSKLDIIYSDGDYYYNGLKLNEYDVETQTGKASKHSVTKHNQQFETKTNAEPLDLFSLEKGMLPNEYKLPVDFTGDIETIGSEYNSKGELVNIATGEAILEYNNKLMDNTVEPEVIENKGSYIDVSKYDKSEFTYMESDNSYLIDYDLLTKNEVTGKWELNGLEMDTEYGAFAEVSKEKIDAVCESAVKRGLVIAGIVVIPIIRNNCIGIGIYFRSPRYL